MVAEIEYTSLGLRQSFEYYFYVDFKPPYVNDGFIDMFKDIGHI